MRRILNLLNCERERRVLMMEQCAEFCPQIIIKQTAQNPENVLEIDPSLIQYEFVLNCPNISVHPVYLLHIYYAVKSGSEGGD